MVDHWDRVGSWGQQWLNLRYAVRLLVRLGAEEDAVILHHCLLAAAKHSAHLAGLLDGPGGPRFAAAAIRGDALSGPGAVTLVRQRLGRLRRSVATA